MEIKVVIGDITKIEADAIIVNLFEGQEHPGGATAAVDKALDGALSKLIAQGEIKGKSNEVSIIHSLGKIPARIVVVAGLGKQADFTADKIRKVMAQSCRLMRALNCSHIATIVHGAGAGGVGPGTAVQAIAEGCILGLYDFRKHITKEPEYKVIQKLTIVGFQEEQREDLERSCADGRILAEAANLARDMINEPANYMTPTDMSHVAAELASS